MKSESTMLLAYNEAVMTELDTLNFVALNPPQIVLEQVSAYKTEMDSIAQFVEQECDIDPDTKYSASKLYEAYCHYCQAIGRKPQSTNAFKKALDKLAGVYQSRTASGMQWHGIRPLIQF